MVAKVENMKKEMISRKEVSLAPPSGKNNILIQMDELTDNFSGPNRLRIVTQVKREIRKNKRVCRFLYFYSRNIYGFFSDFIGK